MAGASGAFDSLRRVTREEPLVGRVVDPDGQEVVLLARVWEQKISRDHPELAARRGEVLETVTKPDHVEPDALPDRSGSTGAVSARVAGCWQS